MAIPINPGGFNQDPTPSPLPGPRPDFTEVLDRLTGKPVQNLPGTVTGESVIAIGINPNAPNNGVITHENQGYAVDTNDNGRYDRGQDAVIGIDSNRDGKIDQREIEQTNAILSAYGGGSADTDGDGRVSKEEKITNAAYRARYGQLDRDHDGKLSNKELDAAGAKAWVDRDRDGKIDQGETQSIDHIRTGGIFNRTDTRITEIDPNGKSKIRQKEEIYKSPGFPQLIPHGKLEGKLGHSAKEAAQQVVDAAKPQPKAEQRQPTKIEHKVDNKK